MISIQTEMTRRALELLELPLGPRTLLLDIGCGSGLSGNVMDNHGVHWVGIDISAPMLGQCQARHPASELVLGDMGDGLPFREAAFDGAIGISCLQWLCAQETSDSSMENLVRFFRSLRACLRPAGRAVFQFYPENDEQSTLVTRAARKAGFKGGVMVDDEDKPRQRKFYLCLSLSDKPSFMRAADRERWQQRRNQAFKEKKITQTEANRKKRKFEKKSKYSGRRRSKKFKR